MRIREHVAIATVLILVLNLYDVNITSGVDACTEFRLTRTGMKTITVDCNGTGDYKFLQEAINAATPGDIIRVFDGWYIESVVVDRSLSIIGNGSTRTFLDAVGTLPSNFVNFEVLRISATDVYITGFSIVGGNFYNFSSSTIGIMVKDSERVSITEVNSSYHYYPLSIRNTTDCVISDSVFVNNTEGIQIEGLGLGIIIKNSQISCYSTGIILNEVSNISIANNTIRANIGILFRTSHDNYISGNQLTIDGGGAHFLLFSSNRNVFLDNINMVRSSSYYDDVVYPPRGGGVSVINSAFNVFYSNSFERGRVNIGGKNNVHWLTNEFPPNTTFNGTPVSIIGDGISPEIPYDSTQYIFFNCTNITLRNIQFDERTRYLTFNDCSDIDVTNVTFLGGCEIDLNNCVEARVVNNRVYGYSGIIIGTQLENVEITENRFEANDTFWPWYLNGGISLGHCTSVFIENNHISNGFAGIDIDDSDDIHIIGNTCNSNLNNGISIMRVGNSTIRNNTCDNNYASGIKVGYSMFCEITGNTCRGNGPQYWSDGAESGIGIIYSYGLNIVDNKCLNNDDYGIHVSQLTWQEVSRYSTDIYNNASLVLIESLQWNMTLINNNCSLNGNEGINVGGNGTYLTGNVCIRNYENGVRLGSHHLFENNFLGWNRDNGLLLTNSLHNMVVNNTFIGHNDTGLRAINAWDNEIHHNNFIDNDQNVVPANTEGNIWCDKKGEGNYWSDYTGSDDGGRDRPMGDGIGDTQIPHLGLDEYPFIVPDGWIIPALPMIVGTLGILDGNFTLRWNPVRARSYVLEESVDPTLTNWTIIFEGHDNEYDVTDRPKGRYYYRVRGLNENTSGEWSNIWTADVDPDASKNDDDDDEYWALSRIINVTVAAVIVIVIVIEVWLIVYRKKKEASEPESSPVDNGENSVEKDKGDVRRASRNKRRES